MDLNGEDLSRRWQLIQEQLICLWVSHKPTSAADGFSAFLTEGFKSSVMTLSMFTEICYFLLGIINKEERDKLIKWPVVNIQAQVKFRKGVSAIVKGLIKKYPNMSIRTLPESYLIEPSHNQKKILDFILKLANLAIYLSVNDPLLLEMKLVDGLNESEIDSAMAVVKSARIQQEKIIEENIVPIDKFESIRISITNKCVALKQENSDLIKEHNTLKNKLIENGVVGKEVDCNVEYLKKMYNEKMSEMAEIERELKPYSKLSSQIVNNLNACLEPVTLSGEDLGLGEDGKENLADATTKAIDRLVAAFDSMKHKDALPEEKKDYLNSLEALRNSLLNEKNALQSFLTIYGGGEINL